MTETMEPLVGGLEPAASLWQCRRKHAHGGRRSHAYSQRVMWLIRVTKCRQEVGLAIRISDATFHVVNPRTGYSFFDDSSLLANHTPAAEFTPGDFSAWLDANAPDLASMLPSTFPVDSVNAFNHPTRTSDALTIPLAQTAPNQDGHFEDYFNQGWPK